MLSYSYAKEGLHGSHTGVIGAYKNVYVTKMTKVEIRTGSHEARTVIQIHEGGDENKGIKLLEDLQSTEVGYTNSNTSNGARTRMTNPLGTDDQSVTLLVTTSTTLRLLRRDCDNCVTFTFTGFRSSRRRYYRFLRDK
jgi:hypothetical protein